MNADDFRQWGTLFFTYIPVPASQSIPIPTQSIEVRVTYFGIISSKNEKQQEYMKILLGNVKYGIETFIISNCIFGLFYIKKKVVDRCVIVIV